jgi:hypothetical protein
MRHVLKIAVLAALVSAGAAAGAGSASAQEFRFRVGPDRDRVERRVIERRVIRPAPRRTVCTTRMRETVTPGGRIIRRPVEVCRTRGSDF